jgi:hypothetical protein
VTSPLSIGGTSASAAPPAPRRPAAQGQHFASLVGQRAAAPRTDAAQPWRGTSNAGFRALIAQAEGSTRAAQGGYGLRNAASGALGRYQFLPSSLQDIGWRNSAGGWTSLAEAQGVRSDDDFLANPAAQEAAMGAYLRRVDQALDRNGSLARAGTSVTGTDGAAVPLTEAGLMAAAHRRGAGMVARWLRHRTETPDAALSARERLAFAQVERRIRDFAATAYASERRPSPRAVAELPSPAS